MVPELARARLFEAAVEAIEHACADGRWCCSSTTSTSPDAASLELLAYAARRFAGLPVLALLTRRHTPEAPGRRHLLHTHRSRGGALIEIELSPLPRSRSTRSCAASRRSAPTRASRSSTRPTATRCWPWRAPRVGGGHTGPPPSLQAVVRAALGRLDPGARRAAELAAVAGRDLTRAKLDRLTTLEDVLGALDSGLFAPQDQAFGFRHALLREAAGAHLRRRRRRPARQLAGVLGGSAAEIARHLRLAGRDDEAAEHLASAAADALAWGGGGRRSRFSPRP